jgi:EAL domain-containing protein (putative c-di-GMP-specific phosphodiesterase class I)
MKILMDDFGTGYSSLSFLGRLPIDTLKIAREFVEDIKIKNNNAIVSTIVSMAYHLNLAVIAEGVETIEQIEILKKMKCYNMQGYFYSKPIPLYDMEQLLAGNRYLPISKISV